MGIHNRNILFLTHNLAQEKKGRYQSVGAGSHKARRRE
jgi:hypothetical protein